MKKSTNKNTYAIIGLGRFGYPLAMELAESGADLLVIDKDEEKIKKLREYTENAYVVTSLDKQTLLDSGIQNADVAIVALGKEMALSILTTMNLVSIGVRRVIAKAITSDHGLILEKLGGGGHITLAGAQLEGMTMEESVQELKNRINEYFSEVEK